MLADLDLSPTEYFNNAREEAYQAIKEDFPDATTDFLPIAVTKPPPKPLFNHLMLSGSQHAYIESLDLKRTSYQTYELLKESLQKVSHFFSEQPLFTDDF